MRNVRGSTTTLDEGLLRAARLQGDAPADALAADICARGDHALVAGLVRNHALWDAEGRPAANLPDDVRQYFETSGALPDWADPARVRLAEEFFLLYGLSSSTLLACASLPECYVMKYGTEVLAFTRFLEMDPGRRVRETAQMVMDVMSPGGLVSPDARPGRGVQTTQKVRLMHAIIRQMVLRDQEQHPWPSASDAEAFGYPINQEDLVYTLMTFSHVAVRGFQTLGVPMTDAQKDAYIHCWNLIGHLMGIRDDLLPATHADAAELFTAIRHRQAGASEAGQALMAALLGLLDAPLPRALRGMPAALTRDLVGYETAEMLGVAAPPLRERLWFELMLMLWRGGVALASRLYGNRAYRFSSELLHRTIMLRIGRLPEHGSFEIPPEFADHWFPCDPPAAARAGK
jgi:hypothetical protein